MSGKPRHGHAADDAGTSTYRTWKSMIQRCANPKAPNWKHYGARGITVCERWKTFDNFLADMGERPAGTTIDRIDVDGNYEPGNCRWATRAEQALNTQQSKLTPAQLVEIQELAKTSIKPGEVARRFGISSNRVNDIWRKQGSMRAHKRTLGAATHCPHGHAFTPENTYVNKNGSKVCRICRDHGGRAARIGGVP